MARTLITSITKTTWVTLYIYMTSNNWNHIHMTSEFIYKLTDWTKHLLSAHFRKGNSHADP